MTELFRDALIVWVILSVGLVMAEIILILQSPWKTFRATLGWALGLTGSIVAIGCLLVWRCQ